MTKKNKIFLIVGIVLAVVIVACSLGMTIAWSGILSKSLDNENLEYRVLQLTDVHMMNNDKKDKKLFDTITKTIEKSNPDFIVVTGDISSNQDNEADFKKFAEFMETFKIEWTFTFGNHDTEGNWGKEEVSDYLESLEYCSYTRGEVIEADHEKKQDSYGNYYKVIENDKGELVHVMFFMDSNMYDYNDKGESIGYDKFNDAQIEWYKNSLYEIKEQYGKKEIKDIPSTAYFHIPMQEFNLGWSEGERLIGMKWEKIFCPTNDDMMFETMLELGSTKGVFVGHDHMNNFSVEYKGIRLSYGFSDDHNIYLVPKNGANIINIKNDGSFTQQGIYRNSGIGECIITKAF